VLDKQRRQKQRDRSAKLISDGGQRMRYRQRLQREDHFFDQVRVCDDRIGRTLRRLLKSRPRKKSTEKVERVAPFRTAGAEARAENTSEDECVDGDHHRWRRHAPGKAEKRAAIARREFTPRQRQDQIVTPRQFAQRTPHDAPRMLS